MLVLLREGQPLELNVHDLNAELGAGNRASGLVDAAHYL